MHKNGKFINCSVCGKEHYRPKSNLNRKTFYCSLKCRNFRKYVNCSCCGKELLRKRGRLNNKYFFCSNSCHSKYRKLYFLMHPELKEKIRKWATGRKQSFQTVNKRISKTTGKRRTKEQRDKMRLSMKKGEDSHSWKGGISPIAYRLRRGVEFSEWRNKIFKRDNYTCQFCKKIGGILHPHHIISFSNIINKLKRKYGLNRLYEIALKDKFLWDINNGITLCVKCHKKTPNFGRQNGNKASYNPKK